MLVAGFILKALGMILVLYLKKHQEVTYIFSYTLLHFKEEIL